MIISSLNPVGYIYDGKIVMLYFLDYFIPINITNRIPSGSFTFTFKIVNVNVRGPLWATFLGWYFGSSRHDWVSKSRKGPSHNCLPRV